MSGTLAGKVAIVTGASGGIGAGIAKVLAAAGADIALSHYPERSERARCESTAAEIAAAGGTAVAVPLDVTEPGSIDACVKAAIGRFSRLDILVNNAGVMQATSWLDTSAQDFDRCHSVNLKGVWVMSVAVVPHLRAAGDGRIVNISSGAGRRGSPDMPAYSASKAALISLTQSLAAALAPDGITVNAVCPGIIWTPMCEGFFRLPRPRGGYDVEDEETFLEWSSKAIPLRRPQTAEDVGHAVAFFASPAARNITGQSLNVDGGLMMN